MLKSVSTVDQTLMLYAISTTWKRGGDAGLETIMPLSSAATSSHTRFASKSLGALYYNNIILSHYLKSDGVRDWYDNFSKVLSIAS